MATVAPTTAGVVQVVEWPDNEGQKTLPASVALVGGTFARENASGEWEVALATSAANAAGAHLLLASAAAGVAVTGLRRGVVAGFTVSQAHNASLFISDTGTLADAAGTASVAAGRVTSGTANLVTASQDKLIRIDVPV
jgi:hypothetical protein